MKQLIICLLFISVNFSGFYAYVSESNAFIYSKLNYSNNFLNVISPISITSSGCVFAQPYTKSLFCISNSNSKSFQEFDTKNYIVKVLTYKSFEVYCFADKIVLKSKFSSKSKTIYSKKNENWSSFICKNDKITFTANVFDINTTNKIYQYDFKKRTIKEIYKSKNQILLFEKNEQLFFFSSSNSKLILNELNLDSKVIFKRDFEKFQVQSIIQFDNSSNFSIFSLPNSILECKKGKIEIRKLPLSNLKISEGFLTNHIENQKYIYGIRKGEIKALANTSVADIIYQTKFSPASGSFYCGTNTNFIRLFPLVKKYPALYFGGNSNSVFSLIQDQSGSIWAGSYQGALTKIENSTSIRQSIHKNIQFVNGGICLGKKVLIFGEGNCGAFLFESINSYKNIIDSTIFLSAFKSRDSVVYLGTCGKGIWSTSEHNILSTEQINWKKYTKDRKLNSENVLSITEDKNGNIWSVGARYISILNPKDGSSKTWTKQVDKKSFIGSKSIVTDTKGNIWIGCVDGSLIYYKVQKKRKIKLSDFQRIKHPFFENANSITFLHIWKNYLIIGAEDKIILFDLEKWENSKQINVKYLNPLETSFNTETEQNTCLTDSRDSSIWFSTNDMVYQWSIQEWLNLKKYVVVPKLIIELEKNSQKVNSNCEISFKPTQNSFDFNVDYQSLDNMPRYLNGVLVKKGSSPIFGKPDLITDFHFSNLSSGNYTFYVRICQQDGTVSIYPFHFEIEKFLWQKWWFWLLLSLIPIGFIIFIFQKRNQLEIQKKEISQLNLSSLSNQFRPHFMLNALNSIGSQLEDKPHAEKVISLIGESISILYRFTQKNQFTHSFKNEWTLVDNNIQIQKILFIPELCVEIKGIEMVPKDFKLPVGILQIPIENALLHGLRNKSDGECLLKITIDVEEDVFVFTILDNGVGREKSKKINNLKSHGNGLNQVLEMIKIINRQKKNGIDFQIYDLENNGGTKVEIKINKHIDYDKIKL